MEPFFQFRTTEFTDNCQTTLTQQAGLLHAATTWQSGDGSVMFSDYFLDGFQLTTMTGQLPQPLRLELDVQKPWLAMLYQLDGQLDSKACAQRPLTIGHGHQNMMADEAPANHYTFQGQQHTSFTVHLTRELFTDLVAGNEEWFRLHRLQLHQPTPFVLLPQGAAISTTQRNLIQQIINCPYSGALKKLFLEARFLDLFIEQQTQLAQLAARPTSRDRDLMHAVRDFLDQNYAEPPGLLSLARQFGTNDFKLKKGFKELFGTTVFGYVAERRLTVAHKLIALTDQSVQEVAESVGFSNPAHFATAFRRRFGLPPTQVRRSRQLHRPDVAVRIAA
jgi:AraC-like DNA-binding protein